MSKALSLALLFSLCFYFPAYGQSSQSTPTTFSATEADELSRQVVKLYKQGLYDEALPLAKRVVEMRERMAANDVSLAGAYLNLASLQTVKRNYDEAEKAFQRAVKIYETKNDYDRSLAEIYENLALIKTAQTQYSAAELFYQKAIALREKRFGATHESLGLPLLKLAELVQFRGDKVQARELYGRALDAYDSMPKPLQVFTVNLLENYLCKITEVEQDLPRDEADDGKPLLSRAFKLIADPPNPDITPEEIKEGRKVRGGVLNGKAIKKFEPSYPDEAKRVRAQGAVMVKVTIDETGKVIKADVICGYSALRPASVEAARKWRFSPTLLSGQPVQVTGTITFNYKLN